MSIVRVYNKKMDVTYVYESESYWDKEKQQPRNRRKLIGKIDPVTGEIVPTGKPGRRPASATSVAEPAPVPKDSTSKCEDLRAIIEQKESEIMELKGRVKILESQCKRDAEAMDRIRSIIDGVVKL
ncbi:MAG: hypothetical protein ACI381_05920 [Candidatus Methanomethylophilaceae archaeon]